MPWLAMDLYEREVNDTQSHGNASPQRTAPIRRGRRWAVDALRPCAAAGHRHAAMRRCWAEQGEGTEFSTPETRSGSSRRSDGGHTLPYCRNRWSKVTASMMQHGIPPPEQARRTWICNEPKSGRFQTQSAPPPMAPKLAPKILGAARVPGLTGTGLRQRSRKASWPFRERPAAAAPP